MQLLNTCINLMLTQMNWTWMKLITMTNLMMMIMISINLELEMATEKSQLCEKTKKLKELKVKEC